MQPVVQSRPAPSVQPPSLLPQPLGEEKPQPATTSAVVVTKSQEDIIQQVLAKAEQQKKEQAAAQPAEPLPVPPMAKKTPAAEDSAYPDQTAGLPSPKPEKAPEAPALTVEKQT